MNKSGYRQDSRPVLENEFNFFLHNNILEGLFWHAAGIGCLCKKANLLDQKDVRTDKNKVILIRSLGLSNTGFLFMFLILFFLESCLISLSSECMSIWI